MERFEATLAVARELGASVERVSLPHADYGLSAYYVLAPAEASSNLARYDGVRYGLRREADDLLTMYTKTRHDGFGAEVKRRVLIGTYALSSGYYDAYYGRAQRVRTQIAEDFKAAFAARRLRRHPDEPGRRLRARGQDRRPAGHVPQRLLHRADAAGRDPRDLDPLRAERGAARRLPARRAPPSARIASSTPPTRSSRRSASTTRRHATRRAMTDYEPVIGLEIHVQLSTRTKMFCGCELSFGEPPNTHTCEVCLGLPGSLPVANAEAIHYGLLIGLALDCELAPRSIFHRKNYFYPDNAKDYQISQYDEPLCRGGRLGDVRIHRVHLEEDAAKLVHAGASGRIHGAETSVVDFNRGGTPLVEIVSEPDVRSAEQAGEWLRLLRTTLRRLGVSDVNMEEGSLRCDANVSIRPVGTRELGTKTELKNMNSFRFIEKGIRAEIARQEAIVRAGGEVEQETLHFDPRTEAITRCAPRRRRTTTATSPSPTSSRSPSARRCSSAPAPRCPSCRRRAPSASSATSG